MAPDEPLRAAPVHKGTGPTLLATGQRAERLSQALGMRSVARLGTEG
ncbi:MAG: hypothetical protein M3Y83_05180 [Actinomycetota bacterium]|nr:hypothetical protein [Actinomycetota bacterium]